MLFIRSPTVATTTVHYPALQLVDSASLLDNTLLHHWSSSFPVTTGAAVAELLASHPNPCFHIEFFLSDWVMLPGKMCRY